MAKFTEALLLAANVYEEVGELDEVGIDRALLCKATRAEFARLRNGCAKHRTFLNKWGNADCWDLSCTGPLDPDIEDPSRSSEAGTSLAQYGEGSHRQE